ncbi:MAG: hypothetical protein R3F55_19625 [Alphaproteobacteria bacterium]
MKHIACWTAACGIVSAASAAHALTPQEVAPLLQQIPPEFLTFDSQTIDAQGRLVLTGIRLSVPEFGTISADSLTVADIDIDGLMGGEPLAVDIAVAGLTLSRNSYIADFPWPFADDVVTGDVAFAYRVDDGRPGTIAGSGSIDFGANGSIVVTVDLAEPDWYPDPTGDRRLPEVGQRVLPRSVSLSVRDFVYRGSVLTALSEGLWQAGDMTLDLDASFTVSPTDGALRLGVDLQSNLAQATLAAAGAFGTELREAFGPDMRSGESFFDFIEWSAASLSYRDAGLADAVLAIAMGQARVPTFELLADGLAEMGDAARTVGGNGTAADAIAQIRRMMLNFGRYDGDRVSVSVQPVVPVSFATLGDVRVDPEHGLHPDDMMALLRARLIYSPQ